MMLFLLSIEVLLVVLMFSYLMWGETYEDVEGEDIVVIRSEKDVEAWGTNRETPIFCIISFVMKFEVQNILFFQLSASS